MRAITISLLLRNRVSLEFSGQNHPPRDTLKQKLKNLHVPPGLFQIAAPSIKTMAANEIAILQRLRGVVHPLVDLRGQRRNVLRIVENFDPSRRLVRCDSFQPLEHLVARQLKAPLWKEKIR